MKGNCFRRTNYLTSGECNFNLIQIKADNCEKLLKRCARALHEASCPPRENETDPQLVNKVSSAISADDDGGPENFMMLGLPC